MDSLLQSIAGFPAFLLYFVLALILLALFVAIYTRVTPYREIALIGLVLPLASAIAHSVSPLDMVAWGVIALVVQLIVYAVTGALVPRFREAIEAGRAAPATLLAALSVSAGILNAASMTY
jgi:putative membrane protein